MGKCESATVSIGVKILLSDLVAQINETTFNQIYEMLQDGCIEDENDYFNEEYSQIVYSDLPDDPIQAKTYLTEQFRSKGSFHKTRFTNQAIPTLDNGCLLDKHLLIPIKVLLNCSRWGHERYGTNSTSRLIDFDLSAEPFANIEKTQMVFMLCQHSG